MPNDIKIIRDALDKNIQVMGEVEFAYQLSKIKIIAVTGTNGKTTVTNLIGSMLNKFKKTITSFGNFNNQIGLPLSILKMNDGFSSRFLDISVKIF